MLSVLGNAAALLMQVFWCRKIINLKFGSYMRCYFPGLLLALPIIVTVASLLNFGIESFVIILIAGVFAFVITFAGGTLYILKLNDKSSYLKEEFEGQLNHSPLAEIKNA